MGAGVEYVKIEAKRCVTDLFGRKIDKRREWVCVFWLTVYVVSAKGRRQVCRVDNNVYV